jgi:hypothetical protein
MTYKQKTFVDFKTLNARELKELSSQWEKELFIFENKLDRLLQNVNFGNVVLHLDTKLKIDRLWNTGKTLCDKLALLENWRNRNALHVVEG